MSTPSSKFPEQLEKARRLRNLNQAELAKASSLQASAISHFETGSRKPSFDNLRKLADALSVTTDFLLGRTDDIDGSVGNTRIHRHLDKLSQKDLQFVEALLEQLENRRRDEQ